MVCEEEEFVDIRRLAEKAKDPRYISGIYNYCDRWCERCAFTARCLNYVAGQEDRRNRGRHDQDNKAFWDELMSTFRQLHDMIAELAQEHGIELSEDELEAVDREERRRERESEKHPLAQRAFGYGQWVDRWFEAEGALFAREHEAMDHRGADRDRRVEGIAEAVEVIRWYQNQVYVKLRRALDATMFEEEHEEAGFPKDSDGSAKVVLLAIDRSICAWGRLREFFPDTTDTILDGLLELDRLRKAVEQHFPHARTFVRPGFDTGEPAAWETAREMAIGE